MSTFWLHFIGTLIAFGLGLFLIESLVEERPLQLILRLTLVASVFVYLVWAWAE